MECPICFDCVNYEINCVTTECGHCFHTSCLMTNISHNGFACPCCRTAMAIVADDDDSEWSEESETGYISRDDEDDENDDHENDENEDENDENENEEDEFALRGFRFFMNRIEGEPNDPADFGFEEDVSPPTVEYVTKQLLEKDVTMQDLVTAILVTHEEYSDKDAFEKFAFGIWTKFRETISEYKKREASNEF